MAIERGVLIAWSAGVSAAAAGMAALFADGKALFDRVVFGSFSVIGAVTFLILVGAAIPASWLHFLGRRGHSAESGAASAPSAGLTETGALVQTNIARDNGSVFAAQGGDVIVHPFGPSRHPPMSPSPGANEGACRDQ